MERHLCQLVGFRYYEEKLYNGTLANGRLTTIIQPYLLIIESYLCLLLPKRRTNLTPRQRVKRPLLGLKAVAR